MHLRLSFSAVLCAVVTAACSPSLPAVELVTLDNANWDAFAPQGKEVDCILGDYVLRNDRVVAVIARPMPGRNANMTVRNVGGMVIDLTSRAAPNDQLGCFYAGGTTLNVSPPAETFVVRSRADGSPSRDGADGVLDLPQAVESQRLELQFHAQPRGGGPRIVLSYALADGDTSLSITTSYENTTDQPQSLTLQDAIRADRTFTYGIDDSHHLFWADDEFFRQAYGVIVDDFGIRRGKGRGVVLEYVQTESNTIKLAAGESKKVRRQLVPADSLLGMRGIACQSQQHAARPIHLTVHDPAGPVGHAKVSLSAGDKLLGSGRTQADGSLEFVLPDEVGSVQVTVEAVGRPTHKCELPVDTRQLKVEMQACGYVDAKICAEDGGPIPCKVAFYGLDGTSDPDWGPDSGHTSVKNLQYSHDGMFRCEIGPGKYDVLISYGPEHDAVSRQIEVQAGQAAPLAATLRRSVDTPGWISSDFHSHSSPSGDNTSSQLGRVQNLLCEHIEFAPCTEHNRIDTYMPHLERLGVVQRMATCTGMELTGSLLPINHQNAFPLLHKPRTQDGGGPVTDLNPLVQIERLAMWDDGAEKLIQENHPNIPQLFGDRDTNGQPDEGFREMLGLMDAIEVHPPATILVSPGTAEFQSLRRNPIFHWMQLLNLGHRITGVVNTDAHYTFHDSGWLRNYIKSPTDDPAKVDTMNVVHASERGNIVMTNGPFLQVQLKTDERGTSIADPGDDITLADGTALLHIRVQCSNWLDVNRVQVFLNGRASEALNFTRREHPDRFGSEVVKFDAQLPLQLTEDTHVIVAAAGEGLELGRVMGPRWGKEMPIAVSNPIFADVDGGGFKPNRDMLDAPLPGADKD